MRTFTAITGTPPSTEAHSIVQLAHTAEEHDGVAPLSEHTFLHLRHDGQMRSQHILGYEESELVAYAHVDNSAESSAELVVHPRVRRRHWGSAVLERVHTVGGRDVRIWAHGDLPVARSFATSQKLTAVRTLHQMRRSLLSELPHKPLPPGLRVRAFQPGKDDTAWLALNRRAFADHPEQGQWTREDLAARQREEWFDAGGFLLAEDVSSQKLLGFHWTKVHKHTGESGHHDPVGEVYVVGVDPDASGRGLGAALTVAGLQYLHNRGLKQVLLYVDDDNPGAVRLYTKLGFAQWSSDVQYAAITNVNADS